MGRATLNQVKADFADRQSSGEFVEVAHPRSDSPARAYTTEETLALEQANIDRMKHGQGKNEPIARQETLDYIDRHFDTLNEDQRGAVRQVLSNEDQIQGIQGTAGAGKTTTLKAIREGAEREGYEVSGLAPTSRAAHQLNEAGIESETLQHHLMSDRHDSGRRHLYFVDESSLASTRQVNEFVERLSKNDRVVLVETPVNTRRWKRAGPLNRCKMLECTQLGSIRSCANKIRPSGKQSSSSPAERFGRRCRASKTRGEFTR